MKVSHEWEQLNKPGALTPCLFQGFVCWPSVPELRQLAIYQIVPVSRRAVSSFLGFLVEQTKKKPPCERFLVGGFRVAAHPVRNKPLWMRKSEDVTNEESPLLISHRVLG